MIKNVDTLPRIIWPRILHAFRHEQFFDRILDRPLLTIQYAKSAEIIALACKARGHFWDPKRSMQTRYNKGVRSE